MRVLAFDPGYDRLGVAVVEKKDGKEVLIHSECVTTEKADELHNRLHTIGVKVEQLLVDFSPDVLALETLFFNKNQKTGIAVAEVRGIILFLGIKAGCRIMEFGPQQIKVAVTGYGGSDKQAVISMVMRLVSGVPSGVLDDEYDAIAVGVTALAHQKNYE
jgi:crossover junction endodeoxyribonuclease RuvC